MPIDEYDLAVIGGGLAGKVAALRAAELGGRTVLVEAGPRDKYPANSRYTGGVFHIAFQDIHADPEELIKAVLRATGGFADKQLAAALAETAGRAMDWLGDHGARIGLGGDLGFMRNMLEPYSLREPGFPNHWPDKGADRLLDELERRILDNGGTVIWDTRARRLVMDGRRCVGVEVTGQDGAPRTIMASSVLLADGGFQGNPDLVRRYISPKPEALCTRGAGTGLGDGLQMAEEAGAALAALDRFYGHVQCAEAVDNNLLWPYPILDIVASAAVVVGPDGRRFTDEGLGGVSLANAIARLEDPLSSFVVMDEHIWDTLGRDFLLPPNPTIEERGAKVIRARSVAELAAVTGLHAQNLAMTLEQHNAAISSGDAGCLDIPRTGSGSTLGRAPSPISTHSLVAIRLAAGITYTMGGIVTDPDGQVVHRDGDTMFGLYAAGATTAGLEGGPVSGYVGGLAKALVFGLRAAEHAAAGASEPSTFAVATGK
jgi:fumarate reductase flavoprotein subunit